MVFFTHQGGERVYCNVIIDIVHENVASPFTYRIPEGMRLTTGQRVAVPFGSRVKEGIVIGLNEKKVKDVIKPLEDYAAILPELMKLAEKMAGEAHCPLAETLRLMLPAQMRGGRVRVKTVRTVKLAVSQEEALEAAEKEKRSRKRAELLEILSDGNAYSVAELARKVKDPNEALKKLSADGLIALSDKETLRIPGNAFSEPEDSGFVLTPGQRDALDEILPCLQGKGGKFLLHGVTGSGKTEVFMAAVRNVLSLGRGAIILVPEIALTPQMVSWFRGRFGERSAVIHSRLSAGEKL